MGAEEGATITSALAERALCCGRAPIEAKADIAAKALLVGDSGDLARRGAWLTLAARASGLENDFFPPQSEAEGGGSGRSGKSKAAAAAAAPKAVSGCVRAMSVAIQAGGRAGGDVFSGARDSRTEVGVGFCFSLSLSLWNVA